MYDNQKRKLENSVVCCVDILGYSELILKAFDDGRGQEQLNDIHDAIYEQIEGLKRSHSRSGAVKIYTDNIVIGKPVKSHDGEGELGNIFFDIGDYQLQLALRGYFVRGAITVGPHYMDDNIVYGSALLEAHNLESSCAVEPRIILSNDAINLVKEHMAYYGSYKYSPQARGLLQDCDGRWFVNYLNGTILDYEEYGYPVGAFEMLGLHKEQVEKKLNKFKKNPKVFKKYVWVANYHNYFCEKLLPSRSEIKIPLELINLSPTTIKL